MKNVAAALFIQDKSILIAQRAKGQKLEGLWEFPGGKQEVGETIYECLEREIEEELNVNCTAKKIFAESIYKYENGTINLIAILSDLKDTSFELQVHSEVKWVNISELDKYNFAPADIEIVYKLIEEYGKNK